jgi:hypothetical protein
MKLNYPKTIIEQIDEAVAAEGRTPDSITLDKAERHELYKLNSGRFTKNTLRGMVTRGWLHVGFRSVPVLAEEDL